MDIKNVEFKAKVESLDKYETILLTLNPIYQGMDHQIDTYFKVKKGRLKLREGNIENSLINYDRENTSDSKRSDVVLYQHKKDEALKQILSHQLGIMAVVNKKRKIYFIENVKFHFDLVENLGTYLEVEAIDGEKKMSIEALKNQCDYYFDLFKLNKDQLVDRSYSDLILDHTR